MYMLVSSKMPPLQQPYTVVPAGMEKKTLLLQQPPAPPPVLWLPLAARKNNLVKRAGEFSPVPAAVLSTMLLLVRLLTILLCLPRLRLRLLWSRLVRRVGNRLLLVLERCLRGRSLGLVFVGYEGRGFLAIYHYSSCYYYWPYFLLDLALHCKGAWELGRVAMSVFAFVWLPRTQLRFQGVPQYIF